MKIKKAVKHLTLSKNQVRNALTMICTSFTVVVVLLSTLDPATSLPPSFFVQFFSCTTFIGFLSALISNLPFSSQLLTTLLQIAVNVLILFGLGAGIFGWYALTLKNGLILVVFMGLVYYINYLMMTWQIRSTAEKINQAIEKRRQEEGDN